jgi:hypothetical protein
MTKEEIQELEERLRKTVHVHEMWLSYLGFTLGHIKLNKEEIQEVMNFLIEKEEYELCNKLQKKVNMTNND